MVQQYLDHAREILSSPISEFKHNQRTTIGHISLVGHLNRYDLRDGFPLLTTKRVPFKTLAHELVWFLRGETNIKYLVDNNVRIWNDNSFQHNLAGMVKEGIFPADMVKYSPDFRSAQDEYVQRIREDENFAQRWGDLGPVYGSQWVHWPKFVPITLNVDGQEREVYIKDPKGIDQIAETIDKMKKNITSKKYIISAWHPEEVPDMALPPCHTIFHLTSNGEDLDLQLYQRSADMLLGVPFNIASYAMLTQIMAQQLGLKPRRFIHTFGDAHFYCGGGERAQWYAEHLDDLKKMVGESNSPEDFSDIKNVLEKKLPPEPKGRELQDHVTGILEQLSRTPGELPKVTIADKPYGELTIDDFTLEGYHPAPGIKRAMAF